MRRFVDIPGNTSARELRAMVRRFTEESYAIAKARRARGWRLPPLYVSGVVYRREPLLPGETHRRRERWQSPDETYALGYGDCEDVGVYRVVELWLDGELGAYVDIIEQRPATPDVPGLLHAIVRRGDGSEEDPTRLLKEAEGNMAGKPSVELFETEPGVFTAAITWGGQAYSVTVRAIGDSKVAATERAAYIAREIESNPIMSALMPPQAKAALVAATQLGKVARRGMPYLKAAVDALKGPGAQRLARALLGELQGTEVGAFEGTFRVGGDGVFFDGRRV